MSVTRTIAAIANREGQDSQILLEEVVTGWRDAGLRVVGLLAENQDAEGQCSAAFLRDIASGQRFSIQLDAAPDGTICHLDTAGLDEACARLLLQLVGADVVVLSKFGKTEAAGGGLRDAFTGSIASGTPLLTTVSGKHAGAWADFAPDAIRVEADLLALQRWQASARD